MMNTNQTTSRSTVKQPYNPYAGVYLLGWLMRSRDTEKGYEYFLGHSQPSQLIPAEIDDVRQYAIRYLNDPEGGRVVLKKLIGYTIKQYDTKKGTWVDIETTIIR